MMPCCLGAGALYLLGRNSDRDAETLKTVSRIDQLEELAEFLDLESQFLPFIVAVSGKVGSETPIECERSGLRVVIVEETLEQHFLKRDKAGSCIERSSEVTGQMTKEVPWYLYDGTGRVHIVGARDATGFALTVRTEAFVEDCGRSPARETLDYLQRIKIIGVKSIKSVLPTGTYLTVVGEVAKDDIGTVRIQKPQKGPFYVSTKSLAQLILELGKWSRLYKYASMGLTVFGIFLTVIEYVFNTNGIASA